MTTYLERQSRQMEAEAYHAVDALAKSGMTKILRSPAHYVAWKSDKSEPTRAMQIGTVTHLSILEPERWREAVAVRPEGIDGRSKAGKEWAAEHAGKIIIDQSDAENIAGMTKSVLGHSMWPKGKLFHVEQSWFGLDSETGVPVKARPDLIAGDAIYDVKTTEDAGPDEFNRTVANFAYHMQAAHYMDITGIDRFIFVAVEKTAPFACCCYELDREWIDIGREQVRRAINSFHECESLGVWPGYEEPYRKLSPPKWVANNNSKH
jgi:hypothetical protein